MPTTRPRYQVTETLEVAAALDVAARRWPGESRSRLLIRLLHEGELALVSSDATARRTAALDTLVDRYDGLYEPGYLTELRGDWPA